MNIAKFFMQNYPRKQSFGGVLLNIYAIVNVDVKELYVISLPLGC